MQLLGQIITVRSDDTFFYITNATVIRFWRQNNGITALLTGKRHHNVLCFTWLNALAWRSTCTAVLHWLIRLSWVIATVHHFFIILSISCVMSTCSSIHRTAGRAVSVTIIITWLWLKNQTVQMKTTSTNVVSSVDQTTHFVQNNSRTWLQQLTKGSSAVMLKWTTGFFTYCPQLVLQTKAITKLLK